MISTGSVIFMRGSIKKGGQGVLPALENHKAIEFFYQNWSGGPGKTQSYRVFLINTGPGALENHKITQPAFNVGPSLA